MKILSIIFLGILICCGVYFGSVTGEVKLTKTANTDLDKLNSLKNFIAELNFDSSFNQNFVKQINAHIDIEERMLFYQLGKEVYESRTK